MGSDNPSLTSMTLLGQLRQDPNDEAAWDRFVQRYAPRIRGWCLQWQLQAADAEDVTQNVLLRLVRKLRTFTYDPSRSFRGWLRVLTEHALADFLAERRRPDAAGGGEGVLAGLHAVEARQDLLARLEDQFDLELMEEAMSRVRQRVEPSTWDAFRLTALEGLPGEVAAAQLGLRVMAVFQAKSRVHRYIKEEIARLEEAG